HCVDGNNLEDYRGDRSKIVSLAFGRTPELVFFIPLWHEHSPWQDRWERVLEYLKPAFEQLWVDNQNVKYDSRWFASKGIFTRQKFCTYIASGLIDENTPNGLKPMSQIILGADAY